MTEGNPAFSRKLLNWYDQHKRDLPWRETADPYYIWLSEIILQQTRVSQGLPYFEKFIRRFPTVEDLANASEQEVLSEWQGLGYYSRARNLHACAREISTNHNGRFPSSYNELLKLKGIGSYTAAAIASFAFGEAVPVIDGNVYRVVSRVFGIEADISKSGSRKVFEKKLGQLIDHEQAGLFNQAIMEFGALQCTPVSPNCEECVMQALCEAFANKRVGELPVKSKKVKVRSRHFNYLVFECDGLLAFRFRQGKDIWQGLHDFYCLEAEGFATEEEALEKIGGLAASANWELSGISDTYKHVLTHRIIFARFFRVQVWQKADLCRIADALGLKLVDLSDSAGLPKPVLISNYLKAAYF